MNVLSFTKRTGRVSGFIHSSSVSATASTAGVSDPLPIPPLSPGARLSVYTSPASASKDTATVEYTLSPDADVIAGLADWVEWPLGGVSEASADSLLGPVSGLRLQFATTATPNSSADFIVII